MVADLTTLALFIYMIGFKCAMQVMILFCMGTAFTAYARLYFMEATGTYQGWTDLVFPHTSYCLGIGILIPLLGLPLSKWLTQSLYSSLEVSKILYMGVFTNGGTESMDHVYGALLKQRGTIETLVHSLLSIVGVIINVSITVSHNNGIGMLIVPLLNFAVLYLFRSKSKDEKKGAPISNNLFCNNCSNVSSGSGECSKCISNKGIITQIKATVKIGLITLMSEYMCLMVFASNAGQGAVIISYISIAWMMRSTMNTCNVLGDKETHNLFFSMLSLWSQLQKRQLPYNDNGLSVVHVHKLVLGKYVWECGFGCMKSIRSMTLVAGVYLFKAVKGTGKSTFLTSLLKNAVHGLAVDTSNGLINASAFSLRAWWNMVFYINNLAGLDCINRLLMFQKHKDIAESIGLTQKDAMSSGCSTGQGCLWALLSLLSTLPKDRGIVLMLDELLSNVELPLRRKIYEQVLPSMLPLAIVIVVDHGYDVKEDDGARTICFEQYIS
jgi:hypothetical protein